MYLIVLAKLFDFASWGPREWASQAVGLVALLCLSLSFLQKTRKGILILQLAGSTCWCINMALLHAAAGTVLNLVSIARATIFILGYKHKWASHWCWAPILIACYIGAGTFAYFTGDGWKAALPCFALVLATVGFVVKNPLAIRIINFWCCPFWLAYQILNSNPTGIVNELICMTAVIIGIVSVDIIGSRSQKSVDKDC